MKQDETEKKSLTKDEHNKGSPFKEQSPNEKEVSLYLLKQVINDNCL